MAVVEVELVRIVAVAVEDHAERLVEIGAVPDFGVKEGKLVAADTPEQVHDLGLK